MKEIKVNFKNGDIFSSFKILGSKIREGRQQTCRSGENYCKQIGNQALQT